VYYEDMDAGFRLRELFHLYVLRQLAMRLASRPYAVKGGICLRFFHRSPRLSEDMDLDIDPGMPVKTLQKNMEAILASDALLGSLHVHGVRALNSTRPKQTETTQRWKVFLILDGGSGLPTRLEFSRRGLFSVATRATPGPEILRAASLAPFASAFYSAPTMVQQKIFALASPSRNAARDLFDLHHLFFTLQSPAQEIHPPMDPLVLEKAIEKVGAFEFNDFRDQVLPYLPDDLSSLYKSAADFGTLRDQVATRLLELLS
jgi:hypothetical protein